MRNKVEMGNKYLCDEKELLKDTGHQILEVFQRGYNCGGFALGIFEWYCPHTDEEEWEMNELCMDDYLTEDEKCDECADIMINHMTSRGLCREIKNENELKDNEYLVLFKAAVDDFHYARRTSSGRWYHKMGWSDIEEVSEEEVYSYDWWADFAFSYRGKLRMLAVEKPDLKQERVRRKLICA